MKLLHFTTRVIRTYWLIRQFNDPKSGSHKRAKSLLNILIADFEAHTELKVPAKVRTKAQWYMAECLYSCESLSRLLDQRVDLTQREVYLLSGALGAMCDMIIDDFKIDTNELVNLKTPQRATSYSALPQAFYAHCYHSFMNKLSPKIRATAMEYFDLLYDAQLNSKKQFNPTLTQSEIDEICKAKGGFAMLALRFLIKNEISDTEKDAMLELGGFIQFCNDAQDLHQDLQAGINTFSTVRNTLNDIAYDLDKQRIKTFVKIKELPYKDRDKDDFLFTLYFMYIGILSKLQVFSKVCEKRYAAEKLKLVKKSKTQSKLKLIASFISNIGKLFSYDYSKANRKVSLEIE